MKQNESSKVNFSSGDLSAKIAETLDNWQQENKAQRLWDSDATLWTNTDESQWTGWLTVPQTENEDVARIEVLAKALQASGFTDVVLLGMGGSSLCSAMMATTFGKLDGHPHLQVLDSTAPEQIQTLQESIDLKHTLFIVASKSGTTLEPNILKAYFYKQVQDALQLKEVGDRFVAVTDPGTALEKLAETDKFKAIFHGVPSIGGRYSALSNFGMLPSGLMGVDIKAFLSHAEQMAQACGPNVNAQNNPGVILGAILGVCEQHKKNKVTLVASPGIHALGAWLEQLLAESTGKVGKGLIPVDQEPLGAPEVYGDDRVFAYIRLSDAPDAEQDCAIDAIEEAGHVVVRLAVQDKMNLSRELFMWEFATAVAGSVIGIDAFNQPDVEESKVLALQMTNTYEKTKKLPQPNLIIEGDGLQLYSDQVNQDALTQGLSAESSVLELLRAHLARIEVGDYFDLSAFIQMNEAHTDILQQMRVLVRDNKKVATCLGFGPRFLHSTGQAYKGGPNSGVFLQITAEHNHDIAVPGHEYTFGLVINAQAQGDFEVLAKRKRRVLRVHMGADIQGGLVKLHALIKQALS